MNFLRNLLGANQGENPRQDQPGGIEPHNLPLNRTREQRVSVSGGKAPPFHVLPEDTHAMIIYWENEVYCDTLVQGASFKKPKGYPKHLIKNQNRPERIGAPFESDRYVLDTIRTIHGK
ncbi:hypothetical protein ACEPPN_003774 [Leptodophora sp. 'Broadleaf-Isolate-01']